MGPKALVVMVTTPPPSGLRQLISMYFKASGMKPRVVSRTKNGVLLPTLP